MPKFKFKTTTDRKEANMATDEDKGRLDAAFIKAVKDRNYSTAFNLISKVKDINVRDPETNATALHFAAARNALPLLTELEKQSELNYLARDQEGRYPSELAWHIAHNEELGHHLQQAESEYAAKHGLKTWPKPN